MATNKNQHFVPRCYLKQFTLNCDDKSINLYNIDRQKPIACAPVKNQCSGDYFYGQDSRLESAIQSVESPYGPIIRQMHESKYVLQEGHAEFLKTFWLFQHLRTEAASKRSVEMADDLARSVDLDGQEYKLEIKEAVKIAMRTFADSMHVVDDLKVCLFRNKTKIPFITSDDPAVLTNRWHLQNLRKLGSGFGLSRAGTIAILPLSPTVLFIAYDSDIYSVDQAKGWVNIHKESDVQAINQHQYLNCRANIFLQDAKDFPFVHESFISVAVLRPTQRHEMHHAVLDYESNGYKRYKVVPREEARLHRDTMVHSIAVRALPSKWPSLLRWKVGGVAYSNGTGVGYVRRAFAYSDARPFVRVKI